MAVNEAGPAMFFAGLILLIPHRIGMSRVNYVIKRYYLPISRAGLLLYKFHNPIEVSLFIGNVLGVCISIPAASKLGANGGSPIEAGDDVRLWVNGGFMLFFLSLMLLSSIFMYIVYISGDDYGHLNLFHFSLILITFFDGFTNAFAFCINGFNAGLYAIGIPVSGALVSLLHNIYKFFSDFFNWDDFDYHVLRVQLLFNIIQLLLTLGVWIGLYGYMFKIHKDDQATGSGGDASPILLLAFSLGTVYAFYPSIAPYSIIDYQYASVIELWILIISAIPTVVFGILDAAWDDIGPGATTTGGTGQWAKGWHFVWFCAIPYILCIQIFMTMLHYPNSFLSHFFNNHLRIGFISVLFNTLREAMQACGFAGAGKQSGDNYKVSGAIASCNKPITLFVMMFCVFTGDGYLQHYRRCCRDCWPTTGFNKYQSFRYWLRCGFKGGSKSFTTSFTDMYHRNIRPQIISYA